MLLNIEHLSFSYNDKSLIKDLSLQVSNGEVVAILGGNGLGKSTLLKLILGIIKPTSISPQTQLSVESINIIKQPDLARQHIAYLPEQAALYPHLTGFENLQYMLSLTNKKKLNRDELETYLTRVGLQTDAWHKLTTHYSKGMRQKLMIALALARQVNLMLLDEPNTGLDPVATADLNRIIYELKLSGVGILIVSHDLLSIDEVAEKQLILRDGKLTPITGSIMQSSLADLRKIFTL
ncbi:MAG: ABC transporter ATP-binding protein [Methylotenera sp.]|nr:ABC transporter ATP-binding protein [Methylotenera sp.]